MHAGSCSRSSPSPPRQRTRTVTTAAARPLDLRHTRGQQPQRHSRPVLATARFPWALRCGAGHALCIQRRRDLGHDRTLTFVFDEAQRPLDADDAADAGVEAGGFSPCSIAAACGHQSIVDFLTDVLAQETNLHTAAAEGDAPLVWQLVRNHTNMVTNNVHAAELADVNGHSALARQLHSLGTAVTAHRGYRRYAQHLTAQRVRWAALRTRFLTSDLRENFNTAAITSKDRPLFDWFFIGTSRTVGLCPDDIYGVIMGFWSDTQ